MSVFLLPNCASAIQKVHHLLPMERVAQDGNLLSLE